jgi:hypothetical protein
MNKQLSAYLAEISHNKDGHTSLRLIYKKLGPIEAQQIVNALRKNNTVTQVRLDSNKLGDRGAQIIANCLMVCF